MNRITLDNQQKDNCLIKKDNFLKIQKSQKWWQTLQVVYQFVFFQKESVLIKKDVRFNWVDKIISSTANQQYFF